MGAALPLVCCRVWFAVLMVRRPKQRRRRLLWKEPRATWGALATMVLLTAVLTARGQFVPNSYKIYTTVLTNGQTLTLPNTALWDAIAGHRGEGLFLLAVATNTTSATVTAKCDVTPDGTNYTTTGRFPLSVTLNSTSPVMNYTNYDYWSLDNCKKLALTSLANGHTNSVTVSFWMSHSLE